MRRCLPLFSALPVAVLLFASACSEGEAALGPTGTLGTAPTTTSTTAREIDPAVIPDDLADIDEAYVQAVVDALFEVDAKATEIFLETESMDELAIRLLQAIYLPEESAQQVDVWIKTLARGTEDLLPGALQNDVTQVISSSEDCYFLEVSRDYSATTTRQVPPRTTYLGITPKSGNDDPGRLNPTAWMLFTDGFNDDESVPEDPCAGR